MVCTSIGQFGARAIVRVIAFNKTVNCITWCFDAWLCT